MQNISFEGHYIIPSITSRTIASTKNQQFIGVVFHISDKTSKKNIDLTPKGLCIKIQDNFDLAFEKIASFYDLAFIKKQ